MFYNDGFEFDENMRVVKCPQCENEEFSDDATYCRIYGAQLYNCCDGEWDGYYKQMCNIHENPGNARFCEFCGKPTYFATENFLTNWQEAKNTIENNTTPDTYDANFNFEDSDFEVAATTDDDDNIPF